MSYKKSTTRQQSFGYCSYRIFTQYVTINNSHLDIRIGKTVRVHGRKSSAAFDADSQLINGCIEHETHQDATTISVH